MNRNFLYGVINPIAALKMEFYRWCALLSVEEILENRELIKAIEKTNEIFMNIGV